MNLDPRELDLRRQTYAWIRRRYEEHDEVVAKDKAAAAARAQQAPAALALVDRLRVTRDIAAFREELEVLTSAKTSELGLAGPSGQMVVKQVTESAPDPLRAGEVVADALRVPGNEGDAADRIASLGRFFETIGSGNKPSDSRAGPLMSSFWMLAEPDLWPAMWSSVLTTFEQLGWSLPIEPSSRYLAFRSTVLALGDPQEVLAALQWYGSVKWTEIDPTLEDRINWAITLKASGSDTHPSAFANEKAMLAILRKVGDDLSPSVALALDRQVTKRLATQRVVGGVTRARYDAWVNWVPQGDSPGWQTAPALRLWFGPDGVLIGLHPGYRARGWVNLARQKIERTVPRGMEVIDYHRLEHSIRTWGAERDFFVGRFVPYDEFDWTAVAHEVTSVASAVLPVLQDVLADGPNWSTSPEPEVAPVSGGDDELARLYAEFVASTGYPTPADAANRQAREGFAAMLAPGAVDAIDIVDFRRMLNSSKYGFPGFRQVLNTTLADADQDAVQAMVAEVVRDLLYGPGEFGERLDRCPPRLKGLGQAGAMKLLAVAYPERFLPVYPLTGTSGKLALLPLVGIAEVPAGTLGARSVRANDLLRQRLETVPELVGDPWGQVQFAYWLRDRETATDEGEGPETLESRLAEALDRCTLAPDSTFLVELVDLLRDKGQIVLYGPPGTGKTYLALELAKALAPDDERRALVQFHPSMAYEDFMEGFRPVLRDGNLTYQLTEGPLIELANQAALDPRPHVLVIDEMNRANLPKVFGELLFLLEYRNHPAKLAYRASEDPFSLPENLWIIGTMNLADRSVGQIDAALRRRFAFVSFSPNDEQNGGLLRRWLTKKTLPTWPADIVDEVNSELEADLGHADLLIGPSYFMKPDLDAARMAVIWRYAIEPLMSDIFHGDEPLVKKYTWSAVAARHDVLMPDEPADAMSVEPPDEPALPA